MRSLRKRLQSSTTHIETLRMVISRMRTISPLYHLPDRFADLIDIYDRAPVNAAYRQDIFNLLSCSVDTATHLATPTIDASEALQLINHQITILTKLSTYLSNRPARIGYSILSPQTNTLLGQYNTKAEAEQFLASLGSLNHDKHALVVPVKIVSQFAVRPAPAPEPDPAPLSPLILPTPAEFSDVIAEDPSINAAPTSTSDQPTAGKSS